MRIVKNLLSGLHRTYRQTHCQQLLGRFRLGLTRKPLTYSFAEPPRHVLGPVRTGRRAFFTHKVWPFNGLAEFSPIAFRRDNETDVSIFTEERSPRGHI